MWRWSSRGSSTVPLSCSGDLRRFDEKIASIIEGSCSSDCPALRSQNTETFEHSPQRCCAAQHWAMTEGEGRHSSLHQKNFVFDVLFLRMNANNWTMKVYNSPFWVDQDVKERRWHAKSRRMLSDPSEKVAKRIITTLKMESGVVIHGCDRS